MELKYLKVVEINTSINIIKKRFICHKCNKRFVEELELNAKGKTMTNKLTQKILKDLLKYNLSIKYIAEENNVSPGTVRNVLIEAMDEYPKHIKNLPKVISLDEFSANTQYGKYAFVLNDPIHRKCLDILPKRKKSTLYSILHTVIIGTRLNSSYQICTNHIY